MKKTTALAAMTMLGCAITAPAFAQTEEAKPAEAPPQKTSGFYAGGGINLYFIDKNDAAADLPVEFIDQPSPGAWMGRIGYAFNQYLAIEAEAGIGGAKSEFGENEDDVLLEIGVGSPVAAHAVVTLPVGGGGADGVYLLGKAGYSSFTMERELFGEETEDVDISGTSFGFGAGVRNTWDFRIEYSFISGDANSGVLGMFAMKRF